MEMYSKERANVCWQNTQKKSEKFVKKCLTKGKRGDILRKLSDEGRE